MVTMKSKEMRLEVNKIRILSWMCAGLDIGYVPAGPHAFLRLSGQFGPPPVFFF